MNTIWPAIQNRVDPLGLNAPYLWQQAEVGSTGARRRMRTSASRAFHGASRGRKCFRSLLSGLAVKSPFPETACGGLLPAGTDIWKCIVFLLIRHLSILCVNYFIFIFCGKDGASQRLHHSPGRQGLVEPSSFRMQMLQGEKEKGHSPPPPPPLLSPHPVPASTETRAEPGLNFAAHS